jgi:hypothetical protein
LNPRSQEGAPQRNAPGVAEQAVLHSRFPGTAREQLRVVKGKDTLFVWSDEDGHQHRHVGSRNITVNVTEAEPPFGPYFAALLLSRRLVRSDGK